MFTHLCYGHFGVHFVFLSENSKSQTSFDGMKWHIYMILIVLRVVEMNRLRLFAVISH